MCNWNFGLGLPLYGKVLRGLHELFFGERLVVKKVYPVCRRVEGVGEINNGQKKEVATGQENSQNRKPDDISDEINDAFDKTENFFYYVHKKPLLNNDRTFFEYIIFYTGLRELWCEMTGNFYLCAHEFF